MRIRMNWDVVQAMGIKKGIMKHLTPGHYGERMEDYSNCKVTMLLLRAWSVWRVYQEGWATKKACRQRHFEEEWCRLKTEAQKICRDNGGSLGTKKADSLWAYTKANIIKLM